MTTTVSLECKNDQIARMLIICHELIQEQEKDSLLSSDPPKRFEEFFHLIEGLMHRYSNWHESHYWSGGDTRGTLVNASNDGGNL